MTSRTKLISRICPSRLARERWRWWQAAIGNSIKPLDQVLPCNGEYTHGRILWLNWRDPWHPKAGGAELFTLRIAERLVQRGWYIEWFSGSYPGAAPREERQGITFVRAGTQTTVHFEAWRRYGASKAFDIVIDEINTIPFYAMSYGIPHITLMFQLAREVWLREAPPVLAQMGYVAERSYLRPYRNKTIITISESSAESFRNFGFRGKIYVVPIAVDESPDPEIPQKNVERDVIVIGRITPSKRLEEAVNGAVFLAEQGWKGRLHVVGSGDPKYCKRLGQYASARLGPRVVFHGHISTQERARLLREASVLWMTSLREGWGLVVTEAACHAVPAVVYDVAGLRDAVKNGRTGFVVTPQPGELASATQQIFKQFEVFAGNALMESKTYSWDHTTDAIESIVAKSLMTVCS